VSDEGATSLTHKLAREPLVHFLVLGAGLFGLSALVGEQPPSAAERPEIRIRASEIEGLVSRWAKVWRRAPSPAELENLLEEHVKDEVYYREALAMGLDEGDVVVRRRMRQKLEFLGDDLAGVTDPTEEQLHAYLGEHADAFRVDALLSFRHVYLSSERGERLQADAEELLGQLRAAGGEVALEDVGDRTLLPPRFERAPEHELEGRFGPGFAQTLALAPVGAWAGPVESGFGLHLVWVSEKAEGRAPELSEVREAVEREWRHQQRKAAAENAYRAMRARYQITVERSGDTPEGERE
jgi:hypothetical protein